MWSMFYEEWKKYGNRVPPGYGSGGYQPICSKEIIEQLYESYNLLLGKAFTCGEAGRLLSTKVSPESRLIASQLTVVWSPRELEMGRAPPQYPHGSEQQVCPLDDHPGGRLDCGLAHGDNAHPDPGTMHHAPSHTCCQLSDAPGFDQLLARGPLPDLYRVRGRNQ